MSMKIRTCEFSCQLKHEKLTHEIFNTHTVLEYTKIKKLTGLACIINFSVLPIQTI